jgi:glyoxylase-like metal-dependent hydrolase (beta-lactamase superfamily II)
MYIQSIPVGMIGTNCYVLGDESTKSLAIIDPGDDAKDIAAMVKRSGMEVKLILLTHGHFDHVTAVPELVKLYPDVPVYIHPKDLAQAQEPNQFSNGIGKIDAMRFYEDGDTVQLGDLTIQVLSTPGHTPGSVTLLCGDAMFSGDTLFAGSCGRTDFPGGSYKQMMESLRRLANLKGNYKVYPGHEGFSDLDRERRYNSFMAAALNR